MANPVLESENLISEMSEIGLSISKPSDNLPMMLDIIPLSKQRSIYINVNSFKQGFTPILHIKYKNGEYRIKGFGYRSTGFMKTDFQEHDVNKKIPLNFITAFVFNTIYQEAEDLKLKEIEFVSLQIYFGDLTPKAKDTRVKYFTNKLNFSKEEILNIICKYTKEPSLIE